VYKIVVFIIITLLFNACTTTQNIEESNLTKIGEHKSTQKKALLVGVSNYSPYTMNLPGISSDINRVKETLGKWGFDIEVLYNQDSIKLEEYLKKYKNSLKPNDIFVFFYSGHGSYTEDLNGDEEDGKDETIVLSNGSDDMHFLDDDLYYYFSHIKAKKLIMFDSCFSGTAFKTLTANFIPKTISAKFINKILSKGVKGDDKIEGEYVVLSAAQDNEESLATGDGSLFTKSLITYLNQPDGIDNTFQNLKDGITKEIVDICQIADVPAHHPKLSTSKEELKNTTVKQYLEL